MSAAKLGSLFLAYRYLNLLTHFHIVKQGKTMSSSKFDDDSSIALVRSTPSALESSVYETPEYELEADVAETFTHQRWRALWPVVYLDFDDNLLYTWITTEMAL